MSLRVFAIILSLFALGNAGSASHAAEFQKLEIMTKAGARNFTVELAVTDQERARGLMYRRSLPDGQGMLFDFKAEQDVSMWMENTYISLDMIFIRKDGTIRHIAEDTEPMSRRIISSGGPVLAVLEVVAGTVKKLGIAPGDKVAHPLFSR